MTAPNPRPLSEPVGRHEPEGMVKDALIEALAKNAVNVTKDEVLSGSLEGVIEHCWQLKYADPYLKIEQLLNEWIVAYVARWLERKERIAYHHTRPMHGVSLTRSWRSEKSA
jgi:hypothetical protein